MMHIKYTQLLCRHLGCYRYRVECSEREGEDALVREDCSLGEAKEAIPNQERLVFSIYYAFD